MIRRLTLSCLLVPLLLGGCSRESSIKDLDARVHKLYEEKRYDEAAKEAEKLLKTSEAQYGTNSPNLAAPLNNLAGLYRTTGRMAESIPLYERLVGIYKREKGPEHPETLKLMQDLATVCMAGRRFDKVEELTRQIADAREKNPESTDLEVAGAWNNLGYFYLVQKRYDDAEPLFRKSLERLEKDPDKLGDFIEVTLSHMAYIYRAQKRPEDAILAFEKIAAAREKRLGAGSPALGSVLNNLGLMLKEAGRPEDAEKRYREAVAIFEKDQANNQDLAIALDNLSALLGETGREKEAANLRERIKSLIPSSKPTDVNKNKF